KDVGLHAVHQAGDGVVDGGVDELELEPLGSALVIGHGDGDSIAVGKVLGGGGFHLDGGFQQDAVAQEVAAVGQGLVVQAHPVHIDVGVAHRIHAGIADLDVILHVNGGLAVHHDDAQQHQQH